MSIRLLFDSTYLEKQEARSLPYIGLMNDYAYDMDEEDEVEDDDSDEGLEQTELARLNEEYGELEDLDEDLFADEDDIPRLPKACSGKSPGRIKPLLIKAEPLIPSRHNWEADVGLELFG